MGGGEAPPLPQMYRQKKKHVYVSYMRERLRNIMFRSQNTSVYTINGVTVPCYYLWYGDNKINAVPFTTLVWRYKQQYTDKHWYGDKSMDVRASGASELRKCSHFHLKLLFPSIFCWYFRYFVSETYMFSGLKLHLHHVQSMQFPFITYGIALYINDIIPTKHKHWENLCTSIWERGRSVRA